MKLVASLRVSTDKQVKDGYGLDVQETDVRGFARKHGHKLIRIEIDPGLSGTLPDEERPALLAALKAVRDGEAEGIVVPSLHRLARLLVVQEAILAQIWKLGGKLFTVDTGGEVLPDDPDDPMRTAMRQMYGVFAQLDRAMLIKRMRNGRAAKAAKGGYAYGAPPFGQGAAGKALVDDPAEQAALDRIRQLHRAGKSLRAMAEVLTAEGFKPKRSDRWHPESLRRIVARF
jgi:DNA invertase Pin-like site-specific DNA recombinase